jgi:hypothetical protein
MKQSTNLLTSFSPASQRRLVCHESVAASAAAGASKFYGEAMKQGTNESLLSLAGSSSDAEAAVQMTSLLGNIDEKVRTAILHLLPGVCV